MQRIPPTYAALEQHVKRAAFEGGHVWGQVLVPQPPLPSPSDWSWVEGRGVFPGGLGGATAPPTFGQQHFMEGFSHSTDRKVPSEVVLMGCFMSVRYGNV